MLFERDQILHRSEIHRHYGGQSRGRISTPADHDIILLFGVDGEEIHGFMNGWTPFGIFRFTGEGRYGHMEFTRGNFALRNHALDGKSLHLFVRENAAGQAGLVRYVGEMMYQGHFYKEGPDSRNVNRRMIIFILKQAFTPA